MFSHQSLHTALTWRDGAHQPDGSMRLVGPVAVVAHGTARL
ncbi:hypothetical protein [Streptomyces viridochromogenes]|nr:hypothetical protein [Streptomyces viridochromogenes]